MRYRSLLVAALFVACLLPHPTQAAAPVYQCYIVGDYSHNVQTSTQGLFYHNGDLYETSGGYGRSYLARVELDSGKILKKTTLPDAYFAEGIVPYGSSLLMLTWKSGKGFVYNLHSLEKKKEFRSRPKKSNTEGWGIAFNGDKFIVSDGTSRLYQHDRQSFARRGSIVVKDGNKPVKQLNELEYVNGFILANVWKSDRIAIIDAGTAKVKGWIDLSHLRERLFSGAGVANGIAYNHDTGEIYVTGKNWDRLFAIEIEGFDLVR